MILDYVLFTITTVAIAANGYYSRRRHSSGILISMFFTQARLFANISTTEILEYKLNIINASYQDWLTAIVYVALLWRLGYILGGINTKKKENSDDLPVRDCKCGEYIYD